MDHTNVANGVVPAAKAENVTANAAQSDSGPIRSFKVVVAVAPDGGIGINNELPWKLPGDMKYFKHITSCTCNPSKVNAVIMGRHTWDSIPAKFRPLADRVNVVLSRNPDAAFENASTASSLQGALSMLDAPEFEHVESIFVIGGSSVYTEALSMPSCSELHITRVQTPFDCDTFFPGFDQSAFCLHKTSTLMTENDVGYKFEVWKAQQPICPCPGVSWEMRHEEHQYLDMIKEIMANGVLRGDRTGTGTLSVFGRTMRYSLRNNTMPLLTTKRTFWRGVAEELLWFVKGSTSAKELQDKNVKIWDGNSSREYLDSIGLTEREVGDLGPVYGFQWRHFGAEYSTMHEDYTGAGIDQLAQIIEKLRTNPTDRRMIMSAWNPAALKDMALPPCHLLCQFYVANGELSCQMYQRSADMGLGVPFNIASYSLLTRMIAQVVGLEAGEFVHVLGDAHVYCNHVDALKEQVTREPRPFPKLIINPEKKEIDDFLMEDFEIVDYHPHKAIKMDMAV
jgi:dihydrofolate reductase/thymidylate synthase